MKHVVKRTTALLSPIYSQLRTRLRLVALTTLIVLSGAVMLGTFTTSPALAAPVSVSGKVFSDANSNGAADTGESGISNVAVVLRNTASNTCQSISTDTSGNYSFTNVISGSYEIIEAANETTPTPSTCTPATGKTLAQTIGKDPTDYASTTPNVIQITVSSSNVTGRNFGDHSARSIGNCPYPAYITQGGSGTTIKLYSVNLSSGVLAPISPSDFTNGMNGIGFSLVDAYIYGSASSGTTFNLARTNLDGTIEYLGAVLDINGSNAISGTSFVGDVDQNGIFYSVQGTNVYAIDVNPNSPTFKRYLKKFTLSSNPGINDIAISPIDGNIYTVDNTANSHLWRFPNFSTVINGGTVTIEDLGVLRNASTNATMTNAAKGAIYFAADGTLYAYDNSGSIYAISTTYLSNPPKFVTTTTTAPNVSQNDGARCMFAPSIDLPNTYKVSGTLYKDNNNNGLNNSEPSLGANVTVTIYDDKNSNNIIDTNEQVTTTTTDTNGQYTLSNLFPGTYKIKVDTSDVDIPTGYGLSTPNNLSVTVSNADITAKDFGFLGSISGTVFDDSDGSKLLNGTETGTNAGGLNAVLINSSNQVLATTAVAANGTYTFSKVPANANYTVQITTATATIGAAPPAVTLPTNWVSTGENLNSTIDSTVDGKLSVSVTTNNVVGANFGIEQLPATTTVNGTSQTNPGGTTAVQVPTLAGTDPEDGALGTGKSFKIVTLPTNGQLYYNGAQITTTNFLIANYDPTKLTIDPNDGAITVSFTYAAIDAAGREDPTPATVTIPMTVTAAAPNLRLVKRITVINGSIISTVIDPATTPDLNDNAPNWPLGYLKGAVNGGLVKPGDEVEYTIYFLSDGDSPVRRVQVCDLVPVNSTFISTTFNGLTPRDTGNLAQADAGIALSIGSTAPTVYLTNVGGDGQDRGQFLAPNTTVSASCGTGSNTDGAVVVDVVTDTTTPSNLPNATAPGTPTGSYGFIRFRAKVN